ncbi:transcriptional regulator [Bifidobacterium pseudolongum subsp. globosum]|uniref:transcriptional regulator n=1 Tax=Bifidobacterium pseudolongum TaxID=1694 RepID=UPI00102290CA|nr:transcriptional regulator [Bifidobacterium pseudolongum]RYQ43711.1 transcriptional regulator [Bifidobacterium pseudolongum subsp. globosum]
MSANGIDRKALEQLHAESMGEQISYYRRPFMVLWAAVQEASAELEEDYGMSAEVAQVWVAERLRQVADSLVDRLAEKAVAHGVSKSNVARAAGADPTNVVRRFPRLASDAPRERLLIDDVLDALE